MNPTDIIVVDVTGPPPPKSFDEESQAIVARYVGAKVMPGTPRQIEMQLEQASRRWYPDQKVFALCEFDMVTRNAPTQIWHPAFRHDCDECEFLGRWAGTEDRPEAEVDLYACAKGTGRTYIARFSDEPADYTSGAAFAQVLPPLREAHWPDATSTAGCGGSGNRPTRLRSAGTRSASLSPRSAPTVGA